MLSYIFAAVESIASYVNKVGKYLNKNIDSAYKITFRPGQCDVGMIVYYQVPGDAETFNEMDITLSIASYQNKIRINVTENDANEATIGQIILKAEEVADLNITKKKVLQGVIKCLNKEYEDYEFVY